MEKQSYPDVRHVIMDGGSTDGTEKILLKLPPGTVWKSEPDRGQSHAINKAFQLSTGDFISWINSDDGLLSTNAIADVAAAFEQDNDVGLVYGHALVVDSESRALAIQWVPELSPSRIRFYNYLVQPAVFLRRRVLEREFLDESFHSMMDRELWLRLSTQTKWQRLDKVLAIDRHYPERKALSQAHLAEADGARLDRNYAVRGGIVADFRRKAVKVVNRLAGARYINELYGQDLAMQIEVPPRLALSIQQVALPRSWTAGGRRFLP